MDESVPARCVAPGGGAQVDDTAAGPEDPVARLRAHAVAFGDTKPALLYKEPHGTGYSTLTYAQLDAESDEHAAVLHAAGITRGTRTVIMVPVGPALFAVVYAVLKLGAVPVMVDPGMGLRRMVACFRGVRPEAFVGVPAAHVIRMLHPRSFAGVRSVVTIRKRRAWGARALRGAGTPRVRYRPGPEPSDLLLISFTTGSTGPAKGVEATYGALASMARQARESFGQTSDDVCLVTSPAFAFLHLWEGATCVLPGIAPGRVADADAESVAHALESFGVSSMFGSPALLEPLARFLGDSRRRLPALRCVVSGGAPVPEAVAASWKALMGEGGRMHVTYGATEATPMASIEAGELSAQEAGGSEGRGACLGRPTPDITLRIIRADAGRVPLWSDELLVPPQELGEIVVSGPGVSRHYCAPDDADETTKIRDRTTVWHRTGDLGRFDADGRLWFVGRTTEVVHTADGPLYPVACEGVFNVHPDVHRTAVVGVGDPGCQRPYVCVELDAAVPVAEWPRIRGELERLGQRHALTRGLREFLPHPGFPVDIRHNAKIRRGDLARWAAAKGSASRLRRASAWSTWLRGR